MIEKHGASLENRLFKESENDFLRKYLIDFKDTLFDFAQVIEKSVAYINRKQNKKNQLLVFNHDKEFLDAGTQVPWGTIDPGETSKETLLRELKEETGLSEFKYVEKFDEYQFYEVKSKKYLRRHVFHFESAKDLLDQWSYRVKGDGLDKNLNFHYF